MNPLLNDMFPLGSIIYFPTGDMEQAFIFGQTHSLKYKSNIIKMLLVLIVKRER